MPFSTLLFPLSMRMDGKREAYWPNRTGLALACRFVVIHSPLIIRFARTTPSAGHFPTHAGAERHAEGEVIRGSCERQSARLETTQFDALVRVARS